MLHQTEVEEYYSWTEAHSPALFALYLAIPFEKQSQSARPSKFRVRGHHKKAKRKEFSSLGLLRQKQKFTVSKVVIQDIYAARQTVEIEDDFIY